MAISSIWIASLNISFWILDFGFWKASGQSKIANPKSKIESAAVVLDDQLLIDLRLAIFTARHRHHFAGHVGGGKAQPIGHISTVKIATVGQILEILPAAALG